MKICLITQSIHRLGGAEAIVRGLGRGLLERGHEVQIICIDEAKDNTIASGVKMVQVSSRATVQYAKRDEESRVFRMYWLARCLFNPLLLNRLKNIIEPFAPDVIHTHKIRGYPVGLWRFLQTSFPVPLAHTCHDIEFLSPVQSLAVSSESVATVIFQSAWKAMFRRPSRLPDHVVFPSEYMRELHRQADMFDSARASVILNFADVEIGGTGRIAASPGGGEPVRLLFLGRLANTKGVMALCEAVRLATERGLRIHLTLAGEGPLESRVNEFARSSDDMDFVGAVSGRAKSRLLDECHVVAVPSRVDEAFGIVVAEAFAAARPVLASPRGALPELVEDGSTGWITSDTDVSAVIAGLERICCEKENLPAYSERCHARGAALGRDRAIDEHESLYRNLGPELA